MAEFNMKFKNMDEVRDYAKSKEKTLVILDDYVLDVSTFQCHHPGGGILLKNKNIQTIDQEMKFHHPLTLKMANSMVIGSFKKEISHIIDPASPLLPQIWDLNQEDYLMVINSPHWLFVPSPRLFQWDFCEAFSHIKWYHIFPLPILVTIYLLSRIASSQSTFNPITALLTILGAALTWTLLEYVLHRFVFHSEYHLPDSKVIRYMHYLLHGIHHMLPNDPDRLVHPPIFIATQFFILYPTFNQILQIQDPIIHACFWITIILGYVSYDLTHYSLHHVDTSKHKGSWFHKLQKYHNMHHFGGQEAGFGVTSPLWDYIIGTTFKKTLKQK